MSHLERVNQEQALQCDNCGRLQRVAISDGLPKGWTRTRTWTGDRFVIRDFCRRCKPAR